MRVTLRAVPLTMLWLIAAFPIALAVIDRSSPLAAVRFEAEVLGTLRDVLVWGGGTAAVLALLHPPTRTGLRLLLQTIADRLRIDRTAYMRAIADLRHLETAARQLEAGRAALAAHDATAALPHLVRAIELDPTVLATHFQLGLCLMDLGHPDRAMAPLQFVVAREPGHAFGDALLMLARCLMRLRRHVEAAALLTRHSAEHGGNRRSNFWLGQSRLAAGDRDGARQAFAIAAAPPPQRPRLTASEAWYRARARMALLRLGGRA